MPTVNSRPVVRALSVLAAASVAVFLLVRMTTVVRYNTAPHVPYRRIASNPGFQLFPPSAEISLAEDNNTIFAARPATFGAALPDKGLSAALWIGTGFGEDGVEPQGELGCSDVPGWDGKHAADGVPVLPADGLYDDGTDNYLEDHFLRGAILRDIRKTVNTKTSLTGARYDSRPAILDGPEAASGVTGPAAVAAEGNTASGVDQVDSAPFRIGPRPNGLPNQVYWEDASRIGKSHNEAPHHSDIQSLQEGAEIAGKIVLLRRGGCGFLAKVMWAQRRGAVGVIVGDDRKGGPLIQMYASGDTSFVTIPSVFTAHTTAHLLTALVGAVQDNAPLGLRKGAGLRPNPKSRTPTPEAPTLERPKDADDTLSLNTGPQNWVLDEYAPTSSTLSAADSEQTALGAGTDTPGEETGRALYVTITPTRSTVPLLDMLLLVIASPLLAIVVITGILIFIRTQYQHRAWRAPKAVVDQLPVHIYVPPGHAPPAPISVPPSSAGISPPLSPSGTPSPPNFELGLEPSLERTLTSPLLQRPRSRTTTAVLRDERRAALFQSQAPTHTPSRYSQDECVVCLDEYVAGDRVMCLPCGHEFHESCITPWLVTRRRTCPICKSDVVRAATAADEA
ncbi:hypothetical protein SEPCBS119000_002940 [Sporothrix epigloea]|uniref:RING-type domain-containing protein n=1 Tax=Sporothrix epigloea TaxID=1892477 RepID=A0ABP0DKK7_9PEZI